MCAGFNPVSRRAPGQAKPQASQRRLKALHAPTRDQCPSRTSLHWHICPAPSPSQAERSLQRPCPGCSAPVCLVPHAGKPPQLPHACPICLHAPVHAVALALAALGVHPVLVKHGLGLAAQVQLHGGVLDGVQALLCAHSKGGQEASQGTGPCAQGSALGNRLSSTG